MFFLLERIIFFTNKLQVISKHDDDLRQGRSWTKRMNEGVHVDLAEDNQ